MSETARPGARYAIGAYRLWHRHVAHLLELAGTPDAGYLAHALLAPLAADQRMALRDEVAPARVKTGLATLARSILEGDTIMNVLVLNGPNLGRLGTREPEIYGHTTYADLVALCEKAGRELDLDVTVRQTDHEGEMIGWLHEAAEHGHPVVLNAGRLDRTTRSRSGTPARCSPRR